MQQTPLAAAHAPCARYAHVTCYISVSNGLADGFFCLGAVKHQNSPSRKNMHAGGPTRKEMNGARCGARCITDELRSVASQQAGTLQPQGRAQCQTSTRSASMQRPPRSLPWSGANAALGAGYAVGRIGSSLAQSTGGLR